MQGLDGQLLHVGFRRGLTARARCVHVLPHPVREDLPGQIFEQNETGFELNEDVALEHVAGPIELV